TAKNSATTKNASKTTVKNAATTQKAATVPKATTKSPSSKMLEPFDPNPRNLSYLSNPIFLAELNEGKLDDQLKIDMVSVNETRGALVGSTAQVQGKLTLKHSPNSFVILQSTFGRAIPQE